jgi:hypothetical protein
VTWEAVGDVAFTEPFGTVRACRSRGALVAFGRAMCGRCQSSPKRRFEWGSGPGQRPVPCDVSRACVESKSIRDAYDRASSQAAHAGHPDPHGAALLALFGEVTS